jgi:hypothetical protein
MLAARGVCGPAPSPPEEVALWIRAQDVSSARLKMAGHGPSVAAGLASMDPSSSSSSNKAACSSGNLYSLAEDESTDCLEIKGENSTILKDVLLTVLVYCTGTMQGSTEYRYCFARCLKKPNYTAGGTGWCILKTAGLSVGPPSISDSS